jgi:hypothetical protein
VGGDDVAQYVSLLDGGSPTASPERVTAGRGPVRTIGAPLRTSDGRGEGAGCTGRRQNVST